MGNWKPPSIESVSRVTTEKRDRKMSDENGTSYSSSLGYVAAGKMNYDIWRVSRKVRANAQQPKLFVGMILILIFAEALALYGLIVGIILSSRAGQSRAD
ncbi:hypothetical protein GIB67_031082 [Kingdonia uniflora]|uniref:V-ATPase proteolipid subunit C-like domain-containing protein n=1 Tax=Kingdonia uniflora TaxID=39325 RepID=A0A7J7LCC8_9MAGN|nr:hypothetical protein GIB67_031082 [Kingdonia uniflora]